MAQTTRTGRSGRPMKPTGRSRARPPTAAISAIAAILLVLLPLAPAAPGGAAPLAAQRAGTDRSVQIEEGAVEVPRGDLFVRSADAVWTATGEVLENVSISVRDGVIRAIGPDLRAADDQRVIEGSGLTAIPGIVDAHSHTAMRGTNEGTAPVVPEVSVLDALDHEDFGIYRALSGGVTSALILHGSANPIGGQSAIIKMRWKLDRADQLLVQGAPRAVKFALGENVTRKNFSPPGPDRFPKSRIGVEQVYVEAFEAAKDYRAKWDAYREDPDDFRVPPRRDHRLDALVDIMEGRIDVHAHSYRADEILMLMDVAERYGFQIDVFQHVLEGYKVADEMAAHGAGGSTFSDWWMYKLEAFDAIPHNAAIMHRHGVETSLNSDIPWLQSFMVYEMNKPVRYGGVPEEEALRMLTLYPARQLGIGHRVGSLEEGKDGDLVLLSGSPFDTGSRVEKTVVDGVVRYDASADGETRGEPVRDLPPLDPASLSTEPVTRDDWPDLSDRIDDPAPDARADGRAGDTFALVGGTVHPVSGPAIEEGTVVVRDGRIVAVGASERVEVPGDARRIDVSGRHVYPGLIDPHTSLGLVEIGAVTASRDDRTVGDYNPHLTTRAGIDPHSVPIPVARAAGVTGVLSAPNTGTIQAAGSFLQLRGDTPAEMSLVDRNALVVDFPSPKGPTWEEPELEGRSLEELVELFERAKLYARAPGTRDRATDPFDPNTRPGERVLLEALAPALRGEVPVLFEASAERDIGTLLLFLEEFPRVRGVVLGGDQAYRLADDLAAAGVPVIVGSGRSPTMDRDDPVTAGWENAARLHAAGVKVAFATGSVADVRTLPEHAARAAAYGLPRRIALQGITLAPAEILGLGQVTGSIEEGKRADLIVTDGDPLQITTGVERIFVGGEEFAPESQHTRLWKEFRDRRGGGAGSPVGSPR